MLARLCEITSTRMFCAAMPVAAMFSARMILSYSPAQACWPSVRTTSRMRSSSWSRSFWPYS